MRRVLLLALSLALAPVGSQAQEETLADIRQQLTVLYVEMQRLKRELSTTGSPSLAIGGGALDRINAIEAELQRITEKTEQMENRINLVVRDGTNRIGDLEFRLVELEGGDISALGETTTLGGEDSAPQVAAAPAPSATTPGAQLAVGEQQDFDRAKAAYDGGDYETAQIQFATFAETYTGGPLSAEAHFWRGKSMSALGNSSGAARAFLEAFSGNTEGAIAPDALFELGVALDALGQSDEACTMLNEVQVRFPSSAATVKAQLAEADMGCV
jgi:tol-pal system protein YbgF